MNKKVKINSFGSRTRLLQLDDNVVRFCGKSIHRKEITGIKYWISQIVFYRFSLGRKYHIGFKTADGQLDLVFRSFFGISNKYFMKLCDKVLDEIWEPVTDKLFRESTGLLAAGQPVDYEYCQLNSQGVLLPKKQQLITWDDLVYEDKHDRLVLSSRSNHGIWTSFEYETYWNIDVLAAVLDWVTQEGGLEEMPPGHTR